MSYKLTSLIAAALIAACGGEIDPVDNNNGTPDNSAEVKSELTRNTNPTVAPADAMAVADGNTAFAVDLYEHVAGQEDGNFFYSPYSISVALAMTWAGARGQTEQDMASTMHFTLDQDALHPAVNQLDLALTSRGQGASGADDEPFRLNIANSIWGQKGKTWEPDFLDTLAVNYGAGLRTLDFNADPEGSRDTINGWVEDKTEDRIKDLLPEGSITPNTVMVLTNAIYFNAAWLSPFEKEATRDGDFTLGDGSTATVPFMHQMTSYGYFAGTDFEALEMPYDGGELSMVILLPGEGVGIDGLEGDLDNALQTSLSGLEDKMVDLSLPKFEFETPLPLTQILKDMGMESAFDASADFSGMDGMGGLAITDVLHKAFVAVNEKGTEAAAATAVVVGETSAPVADITVSVDRPFIFLIRDIDTGAVVFLGRVMDPS